MEWFFYIGGGIVWTFIWILIISRLMSTECFKEENRNFSGIILSILFSGLLLTWVWICYKLGEFIL